LDSKLGTLLIRWSLRLADRRSYRDETSRKLLRELGISVDGPLCTDLAYGLNYARNLTDQQSRDNRRLVVGINPLPFFDCRYWPEHNANTYQQYVQTLATFATWLGGRGHKVLLFPTQLRADTLVIQDLKFQMRQRAPIDVGDWLTIRDIRSLEELLSTISLMDIAISTRYHGILLPGLLGKPVVAISYGPKSDELMERIGQGQFVLDINTLTVDSLVDKFLLLEAESDTMRTIRRKEIHQRISGLQRRLDAEYDRVFEVLDDHMPSIAADQVLKPF